ncbi:MAG: TetR/AcrR family transcriptional regulator [Deltaproteobacteria bacterium]|nr:TetR/AcrR family transcriptional regulator [Deltaproteobacteria bacterium]
MSNTTSNKKKKMSFIEKARRSQILDIAVDEIANKGYENFTIQAIAKKDEVNKASVYYHFKGREQLLGSLYITLIDELYEYRVRRVNEEKTATEKLKAYIGAYIDYCQTNVKKFIALFGLGFDLSSTESSKNMWSDEVTDRSFGFLEGILVEGKKNGEFTASNSEKVVPLIQGALDGILTQWISTPSKINLPECQDVLMKMVLSYVK